MAKINLETVIASVALAISEFDASTKTQRETLNVVIVSQLGPLATKKHAEDFGKASKGIQLAMVRSGVYTVESARSNLNAMLQKAGITSPNARGKARGAKEEPVTDTSAEALMVAYKAADYKLCVRIVRKAEADAVSAK